jgi:hypothetical protein
MGVGALCLPETNTNWQAKGVYASWKRLLRCTWQHSSCASSFTKDNFISVNHQPGRTATVLTDNWTSRAIEVGTDPYSMGRWSNVMLRGRKGRKTLLVTAYRVCKQTLISAIGPTTAPVQQHRHLTRQWMEHVTEEPQPSLQFILDLQAWLENMMNITQKSYYVLMLMRISHTCKANMFPLLTLFMKK